MSRPELFKLCLKGLLAWSVLSGLGWYFGESLGNCVLPLYKFVISSLNPDYVPWLKLIPDHHDFIIQLSARVSNPIRLAENRVLPRGEIITAGSDLMHALVPIVIEYSILLVWPVKCLRGRLLLMAFGFLTMLFVLAVTGPFVLIGRIEIFLIQLANEAGAVRAEPWTLTWMIFDEMGGNWLAPIIAAFLCIRLQRKIMGENRYSAKHPMT